jgi:hypothetical protein
VGDGVGRFFGRLMARTETPNKKSEKSGTPNKKSEILVTNPLVARLFEYEDRRREWIVLMESVR